MEIARIFFNQKGIISSYDTLPVACTDFFGLVQKIGGK